MAESDSLALIEIPTLGGRASMLGVGRPFFWHWSPNSKSFVSHYNELMPGTTGEENWTISLNLTSGTKIERTDIGLQSGNFQTPAFSPEGNSIAIVIRNSGEQKALTLFSPIGENLTGIAPIQGASSFSWSPRGKSLAYVDGKPSSTGGIIGRLYIAHLEQIETPTILRTEAKEVISFFWSPDGRKIAVFEQTILSTRARGIIVVDLSIVDAETGAIRELFRLFPDETFLNETVPFNDQYQRSATIWSPDSTRLVVAGRTIEGPSRIYVLEIAPEFYIRKQTVALYPASHQPFEVYGTNPFWSWK